MKKTMIFFAFIFLSINVLFAQKNTLPNIIFIFADDLGYADVACYGQKKIETPNIDKMARNGKLFTNFYSGSTVCSPARTSLMTGLHTGHAPIRGNKEVLPEGQSPLPQQVKTIANILKSNGYNTGIFGKWGLGFTTSEGNPNIKGFDEFYGYICQRQAHDYFPDHLWHNKEKVDLSVNKVSDSIYSASLIHQKAIEYLRKQDHKSPFFVYLPYTLPHADVIVPHDSLYWHYVKKFNEPALSGKDLRKYPNNFNAEPYPHAAFATMVNRLDDYVGEIIRTVEEKNMADNTLIIFTSDNGPHREKGGDPEFFDSNGVFRGIKRDLYEGGIREPFIAYMPKKIKPSVENNYFALWDMFPTFLDFAKIKYRESDYDGISIKPILLNKGKQKLHSYLYWEFHEEGGKQAARKDNWKVVRLNVNKGNNTSQLYDLANDPSETTDVSSKYPKITQEMNSLLDFSHKSNPKWPLTKEELETPSENND